MKMVNMKMSAKESKTVLGMSPEMDAPAYPYGLNIELNNESLAKLGIETLPEAGDERVLMAKVKVVRSSVTDTQEGGKQKSVSLQITDMAVMDDDAGMAEKMYG